MTSHELITSSAQRWYGVHHSAYLSRDRDRMVDACAAHLREQLTLADATARQIARETWAELEATRDAIPGYIDLDRCTGRMVVLRDGITGVSHMVTMPELLALVQARRGG